MTSKDLERTLAFHTPFSVAHLDHVGRALRASGQLPLGGRGIQAPEITAAHAANMLLGIALADTPPQAPHLVTSYAALTATWTGNHRTGREDDIRAFAGAANLGEALGTILGSYERARQVEAVVICRTWPFVIIRGRDGEPDAFYGFADHEVAKAHGYRTSPCAVMFHIPVSTLTQLALELSDDSDGIGEIVP